MEKVAGGFIALALSLSCVVPAHGGMLKCPPDSVKVGDVCIDLYEESVWQIPPSNTALVKKVQLGRVALADLLAAGAVQLGCTAAAAPRATSSPFARCGAARDRSFGHWIRRRKIERISPRLRHGRRMD